MMNAKQTLRLTGLNRFSAVSSVTWIGALSFEERCLGSLLALADAKVPVRRTEIISYSTEAIPKDVDESRRRNHLRRFRELASTRFSTNRVDAPPIIHAYQFASFVRVLERAAQEDSHMVVDCSCLTKIHSLALSSWFSANLENASRVTIAYTRPIAYVNSSNNSGRSSRWRESILSPCLMSPATYSDAVNGVILFGHEATRISLALAECEPVEALCILAETEGDAELGVWTRLKNKELLRQVESGEKRHWTKHLVDHVDVQEMWRILDPFVQKTKDQGRRLVLYPFGPKSLIIAAALCGLCQYPEGIWYCYPVPTSYDVDCTVGIGPSEWFFLGDSQGV
jgi:hypothetical protein